MQNSTTYAANRAKARRFESNFSLKKKAKRLLKSDFEQQLKSQGAKIICGIDEAGRGPLAGPVVAAVFVFSDEVLIEGLNDSKQVPEEERERIFSELFCFDHGIGLAENSEIDRHNILRATFLAMYRALEQLKQKPDVILVDGSLAPSFGIPTVPIVGGDAKCFSIAAASILAKVTRDRIMKEYDLQYPQYGFASHKGYATPEHLAALEKFGPCAIHRNTFYPIKQVDQSPDFLLDLFK